ncbi:hypothetical protein Pan181_45220 [Aeoliella mucimassa]|uniref:Uncharacterized protein n=1 Tax=Aeoliella mucimassa TaxID=2527972 RepID=A0A518AU82_9BACT|nr:hypothetical protein Pan181_45220 [Aeoliella mucimassa]
MPPPNRTPTRLPADDLRANATPLAVCPAQGTSCQPCPSPLPRDRGLAVPVGLGGEIDSHMGIYSAASGTLASSVWCVGLGKNARFGKRKIDSHPIDFLGNGNLFPDRFEGGAASNN